MSEIWHDLRAAARTLASRPTFAAVAILTVALGIGANTAIFSVLYEVLLRPVPYPAVEPDRVLLFSERSPRGFDMSVSYPTYRDWREQLESFETIAGYRDESATLLGRTEPIRIAVRRTSPEYFELQGVTPLAGRFYDATEDEPGGDPVAVLNHAVWTGLFAGRAAVLGEQVNLGDRLYTVVGVLPPQFDLDGEPRIYLPLEPWAADNPSAQDRGNHQGIYVLARIRSGVTYEQAHVEMDQVALRFDQEYPRSNSGVRVVVDRLVERRLRDARTIVWLLFGAVGLVLLIACTNVANLLTVRAMSRQREASICAALGAGRWRIVRQGIVESLLLFAAGGVLGLVLGFWSFEWLRASVPVDMPRLAEAGMDWRVFAYGFCLSLLTGVLFGAGPAWRTARIEPGELLKSAGRESGGAGRRRLGRAVLVAEIALATVLLVGAGLLIRTMRELMQIDPGFRPERVLTLQLGLGRDVEPAARVVFFRELRDRLRALPGVERAAVGQSLPILGSNWGSIFTVSDQPVPDRADLPGAAFNPVDVGYFETLGIALLQGRVFTTFDTADTQSVIVVNERLAETIWPGENPLGKRLKQGWPESEGDDFPWREVVGVVSTVNQDGPDEPARMEVYIPFAQNPGSFVNVAIKAKGDPMSLVEPAKAVVRSLDPDLPVARVASMDEILDRWTAPRRFSMWLLSAFAGVGLFLAAVGIYGVVAYSVAQRTGEFGIRMALGATSRHLLRIVLGQGIVMTTMGLAVGLLVTVALSRSVESLLYGVRPFDPLTVASVAGVLGLVALAASVLPARRALRIDPSTAIRAE